MTDPVPLTPGAPGVSLGTGSPAHDALRARARSVAAGYAALRPTYPVDAVEFLAGRDRPLDVLDVGAGTGTGLRTHVVIPRTPA